MDWWHSMSIHWMKIIFSGPIYIYTHTHIHTYTSTHWVLLLLFVQFVFNYLFMQIKNQEHYTRTKFYYNQQNKAFIWLYLSLIGIIFEMRLLNLRINFYLLRTFCPHLGSSFFFFLVLFLLSLRFGQISPLAFFNYGRQ